MYFNDLEEIMAIIVAVAILGGFIVSTIHDMKFTIVCVVKCKKIN